MILFISDWAKYPNAVIDINTTNKSFVRLASVYREMGIKNHAFLLALHNPQLQGVDPFSTNLTIEQMAMIAIECKENPWYYFREIARAPALAGRPPAMFEANRGNISLFWLFFNHVMVMLTQSRQTGKSFSVDSLMTLLMNIVCENTHINLLTKDDTLRRKNIERLKEIASELPPYLNQRTRDDINNTEELTIRALKNTYTTHVPQASPKRAYNMGRGLTSPIFQIDEGPFQLNIAIALPAALAATGAAIDAAKQAGTPYGTIMTSTAGKKDDKDGKFIYGLIVDSAKWTEKFYDCENQDALEKLIKRNSRSGVVRVSIELSHRQLGKTDQWLKEKLDESLQTGDDASRDYFNQWTSGSETNPLSDVILERLNGSTMDSVYNDISVPHGYITRWYIPEDQIGARLANSKIAMGIDTSEASGGDDISLVMIDVSTLEVIAVGTFNETNLITFSEWICSILVAFTNITAIIERRSTGAMVLDYLLLMLPQHGIDPFTRLFNRVVNDADEFPDRLREIKVPMGRRSGDIYVRYKKTFGFATAATGYASRSEIYSTTLQNAAKRSADKVRDKYLIGQISGLVNKNGRIDHEDGEHDDLVIGWLLCHWLITLGKNLSFYGIEPNRVMSNITEKTVESVGDARQRVEQESIRRRIEEIFTLLSKEQDDFVSLKLENELRVLDKKIILENGEIYSLDALINQAKSEKRNRRRSYDPMKNDIMDFRLGYADNYMANNSGSFSSEPIVSNAITRR